VTTTQTTDRTRRGGDGNVRCVEGRGTRAACLPVAFVCTVMGSATCHKTHTRNDCRSPHCQRHDIIAKRKHGHGHMWEVRSVRCIASIATVYTWIKVLEVMMAPNGSCLLSRLMSVASTGVPLCKTPVRCGANTQQLFKHVFLLQVSCLTPPPYSRLRALDVQAQVSPYVYHPSLSHDLGPLHQCQMW